MTNCSDTQHSNEYYPKLSNYYKSYSNARNLFRITVALTLFTKYFFPRRAILLGVWTNYVNWPVMKEIYIAVFGQEIFDQLSKTSDETPKLWQLLASLKNFGGDIGISILDEFAKHDQLNSLPVWLIPIMAEVKVSDELFNWSQFHCDSHLQDQNGTFRPANLLAKLRVVLLKEIMTPLLYEYMLYIFVNSICI